MVDRKKSRIVFSITIFRHFSDGKCFLHLDKQTEVSLRAALHGPNDILCIV